MPVKNILAVVVGPDPGRLMMHAPMNPVNARAGANILDASIADTFVNRTDSYGCDTEADLLCHLVIAHETQSIGRNPRNVADRTRHLSPFEHHICERIEGCKLWGRFNGLLAARIGGDDVDDLFRG